MRFHTDGAIDRAGYWQGASEDVIRGCAVATFGEPNRALSNGAELRFGKRGSKSVAMRGEKRGQYFDHEQQTGGFLRIPDADFGRDVTRHDGTFRLGAAKVHEPHNGNQAAARALWDASTPITGTLAETYLAARGIIRWVPESRVRFHPSAQDGAPCAIFAVTDQAGDIVAVQRVPLLASGSDRDRDAGKKSLGPIGQGFFVLAVADKAPHRTIVCEGGEDALSVWFALREDITTPDVRVIGMMGQRWERAADAFPGATMFPDADSVDSATRAAARVRGRVANATPHKDTTRCSSVRAPPRCASA